MTNKAEYVFYYDLKLTEKATEIFGSSVCCAYTLKENFIFDSREEQLQYLQSSAVQAVKEEEINLDGLDVAIKFKDCRIIKFTSSEWGSISLFKNTFEEISE